MARGKNKRTVIQVKSAPTTNIIYNLVDISTKTNKNVQHFPMLPKLIEVEPIWKDDGQDGTLATHSESPEDYVSGMEQISPHNEDQNKMGDAFIELIVKAERVEGDVNETKKKKEVVTSENSEKKSKKKNKRKKKKKSNGDKQPVQEAPESCIENGRPVRLEPINKSVNATDGVLNPNARPKLKPIGCFGFVSTWLAKRKEKRRQKKKKAIDARKDANDEPLVEYEHRRAKGGLAFTVELDSRPINKSVLPPIKQRPGPIRMATEQKLEVAEINRAEHIKKRKENARAHSRMVQEVADRRVENEMIFKQTTLLKIKDKEFKATRAPSRLEYDRNMRCRSRCSSRMRHSPDTSKVKITLSSEPIAEVDDVMHTISPLSLDDVPLPQYFTEQNISHRGEE